MARDHGKPVKDDDQNEGPRKKGMNKEQAPKVAKTGDTSKKGGEKGGKKPGGKKSGTRSN